jgi:hypothetical protein
VRLLDYFRAITLFKTLLKPYEETTRKPQVYTFYEKTKKTPDHTRGLMFKHDAHNTPVPLHTGHLLEELTFPVPPQLGHFAIA